MKKNKINLSGLILKSLRYYLKQHLLLFAGAILSTMIICGSLITGDSIRLSLTKMNRDKLGKTEWIVSSGERYFSKNLQTGMEEELGAVLSSILSLRGVSVGGDYNTISENLNVYGIDNHFPGFFNGEIITPENGEIVLNQKLAQILSVGIGDTITLRLEQPALYPVEAPLSSGESSSVSLLLKVAGIIQNNGAGRFSVEQNQRTPSNIYLDIDYLNSVLNLTDKANIMLLPDTVTREIIESSLSENLQIGDIGLGIVDLTGNRRQLISERVFIDNHISDPIIGQVEIEPVFSYFINSADSINGSTPYSFISTGNGSFSLEVPEGDQIIVSSWAAEDLGIDINDRIELSYFNFDKGASEESQIFEVYKIVDLETLTGTEELIPPFHGLSGSESCSQWNPGIDIDLGRIREKDELYWENWHDRPKFFINYDKAVSMWSNRYGSMTGIIFSQDDEDVIREIITNIPVKSLGFKIVDIKKRAVSAGMESVDFAQLFIGLSFFLIIASLIFTGLMFSLYITGRRRNIIILSAMGFNKGKIKFLFFGEAFIAGVSGTLIGAFCAGGYTRIILNTLKTVWNPAVRTDDLQTFILPQTLLAGFGISLAVSIFVILTELSTITGLLPGVALKRKKEIPRITHLISAILAGVTSLALTLISLDNRSVLNFFIAGALGLIFFLSLYSFLLSKPNKRSGNITLFLLAFRHLRERKKQSLGIVVLLSCCFFLITTVSSSRKDVSRNIGERGSGSGGFDYICETAIPVTSSSLENPFFDNIEDIVPFCVQSGNDFSCLNLNKVTVPRIIGVDPGILYQRGSFNLEKSGDGLNPDDFWNLLSDNSDGDIIPAIADLTAITWGLGLKVGDLIQLEDETGRDFSIKLVGGISNSILQGNLIVSEENFRLLYPSSDGFRMFLLELSGNGNKDMYPQILRYFRPFGIEIYSTADRLHELNSVEDTYLDIFSILGSLGLLLGVVALAILIFRNAVEDKIRTETFRALGFNRNHLLRLNLIRYSFLLCGAIIAGTVSSILAIIPNLINPDGGNGMLFAVILSVMVGLSGFLWILLSSIIISRRKDLTALRRE